MIIYELTGSEKNPAYQALEISNGDRQFSFLCSIVEAALAVGRPFLSQHIIKALNFQAITCLHTSAGEYRPCQVEVGDYRPPAYHRVDALMEDFVNSVNRNWTETDPLLLCAFVLWRLNQIHPFINGNGRTARAAAYFVLCVKVGGWLPGKTILPALISKNRPEYVEALKQADASNDLTALHLLLERLLKEQIATAANTAGPSGESVQPATPPEANDPPIAGDHADAGDQPK